MTTHRAPRRRLPAAVLVCLGVLLGGVGGAGTLAYWSDNGTATVGGFSTGQLDLRLDGNLAGPGGSYVKSAASLSLMVPGESFAFAVSVQNPAPATTYVGFDYTATATGTGGLLPGLQWTVVPGGTVGNTGTQAAGNRTGSCTGGTTTASAVTLTAGSTTIIGTERNVVSGGTEDVCVVVRLDPAAANSLQGTTASATLTFTATQVGAP